VSVSLPKWKDVVGWASRDPEALAKLKTGYPRFSVPPQVRHLEAATLHWIRTRPRAAIGDALFNDVKSAGERCRIKLFPNQSMGNACRVYLLKRASDDEEANLLKLVGVTPAGQVGMLMGDVGELSERTKVGDVVWGVIYLEVLEGEAKAFWQHTGYGVSSRFAQTWLDGAPFITSSSTDGSGEVGRSFELWGEDADAAALSIKSRIAASYGSGENIVKPDDVFLFQSGMTAITQTALTIQKCMRPGMGGKLKVAVFG
jgi:cystathionine gamma-synthase